MTSMTSAHPWLARVLPGHFEAGVNSSGYWVFFALVLLVDAVTVLIAGFGASVSRDARQRCGRGTPAGAPSGRPRRRFRGGQGLRSSWRCARKCWRPITRSSSDGRSCSPADLPGVCVLRHVAQFRPRAARRQMYASECTGPVRTCTGRGPATSNAFTIDQIAGAALLNAPDIYGWHFGTLTNNSANGRFTPISSSPSAR